MAEGRLTAREIQCLYLAGAVGLQDKEIAERLSISRRRVGNYLRDAYGKVGVRDRRRAYEQGVRSPGLAIPGEAEITRPADGRRPGGYSGADTIDTRPWLARFWRAPPRSRIVILTLILGWAVLALAIFIGGVGITRSLFSALEDLSRSFS